MQRYKIKIEYDGTSFVGWQFQKNGLSIQEVLQKAIFNISKEKITITGAGRTDSGVHALGQVAHFDLKKKIKTKEILLALNQHINNKLVTILKITKVNKKFHSRFDAKKRTYQYVIINRLSPLTLQKNKAWHIKKKLDIRLMKIGGKKLTGTKHFGTFRASNCGSKSPIKTLKSVKIKIKKEKIEIYFKSKSFLKQQVRSMVGCLKYLGEKKWDLKKFIKVMNSKKRSLCAPPAPPHGLYLEKVIY